MISNSKELALDNIVIVKDKDEGGYVASFPDMPGCITCADTLEGAIANAEDARKAWIEAVSEAENDAAKK